MKTNFSKQRLSFSLLTVTLLGTITASSLLVANSHTKPQSALPQKSSELFQPTKVWTVHLSFTAQAWEDMEPKGGNTGFFGGPPPGGERSGPGGPGGGPPPPGGGRPGGPPGGGPPKPGEGFNFGPSMFLAPAFMGHADKNKDGKISAAEFRKLSEDWWAILDKDKKGVVEDKQLRKGLNKALVPPQGAGGPGGGGGFSLQGREGLKNGVAGAMGIDFKHVHAELEFEGVPFHDVAVRYKGNGTFLESRSSLKRSLKIDLKKYVKGRKLAGVSTINLHNNVTDVSWMNEVLAHRAYRDAGVPAPRTSFARVFVTVPGKFDHKYIGLYSIVENIDSNFVEERFGTRKGLLVKPSSPNMFSYLGEDWKPYARPYETKDEPTPEQQRLFINMCKLISTGTDADFAKQIGNYIDVPEFARYMAVLVWIVDFDSLLDMGQNFYMHLDPKTNKFHFIAWDQDHSFGQFGMMGSQDQREQLSINHPWMGEKKFLERMFKLDAFKKPYLTQMARLTNNLFKPERFAQQVDELGKALRPAVEEEAATKLAKFDKVVAGESIQGNGFGPFPGPQIKPIKPFVKARTVAVAEQLAGKSQGKTLSMGFMGGEDFGPGTFQAPAFMKALDANKDKKITRAEFLDGFAKWFALWDTDKTGFLTEKKLKAGIDKSLTMDFGGPPGMDMDGFGG